MKTKSTYSLLMNADSEEKGRSVFETVVYSLIVICMAVSGWSFVSGEMSVPGTEAKKDAPVSMMANAPALNPARG